MAARYSKQSGYTISTRKQTVRRSTQRTVPKKIGFGPLAARYFGLAVLAIIALVMLTQQSTRATGAYQESALRKSISQVDGDVASLQLEAKRAQSLQNLQSSGNAQGMIPVGNVTSVENGQVAGVSTTKP